MAVRSKASVCVRSIAGIAPSNPCEAMECECGVCVGSGGCVELITCLGELYCVCVSVCECVFV